MNAKGPVILAGVTMLIIGIGLLVILFRAGDMGSTAEDGFLGRQHYHLKNVTRIGGTPQQVQSAISQAVGTKANAPNGQWQRSVQEAIQPSATPHHVIALAADGADARIWALPGAYWAAYAGVPVVFLHHNTIDSQTLGALRGMGLPVYVLAPKSMVSDRVVRTLNTVVPTQRVADNDITRHAVRIAEFRDAQTGFGWGRTHQARDGYFQYVVSVPSETDSAFAALPLARSNSAAFLFANNDGSLPAATDRYLWSLRPDYASSPTEGPFRHIWVIGDWVSYAAQARMDMSLEKAPYASMGPVALGPLEALLSVLISFGLAGGLFVYLHGERLLPDVLPPVRLAWAMTAVFLPILGVLLYFSAYRRPILQARYGMIHWLRPPGIQSAAATAMSFGYGVPLMIAIGYLLSANGLPMFYESRLMNGAGFWLGSGFPLMLILMVLGAVLLTWSVVQVPMAATIYQKSPQKVRGKALAVTLLSLLAVCMGMLTTAWFFMQQKLPVLPRENELLWFEGMWLAAVIGFLVAWPLNWPLVSRQIKPGTL